MPNDNEGSYGFLAQRAYIFLREQGQAVEEDTLIRHIFSALPGQNPAKINVEVWRGVLPGILADTSRFQPLGGRMWALAGTDEQAAPAVADELATLEYIAIDTETTGLEAGRHRLIEVAALRYLPDCSDSTPSDSFISVVNPNRRLPSFIVGHTGINQALVNAAPPFSAIASGLREFIAERILVGHNIGFDIAFLNSEMRRIGQPPFVNPRLDTLALAVRLLENMNKPNLDRVASVLGLPIGIRHRAEADARLARQVFCRLLALARERGVHTRAALLELGRPLGAEFWQRRKRPGSRFDPQAWQWPADPLVQVSEVEPAGKDWLLAVPEGAGVYIMRDENGNPLYVGKATNLRRRVANYYSRDEAILRGLAGLREATAKLELREVGSELAAELLELELIGKLKPGYNTQRSAAAPRQYIRLHQPRRGLPLLKPADAPGDNSFGPYANRTEVDDTMRLLRAIFPALAKASLTPAEYQAQLAEALAFLRDDDEPALTRLRSRLYAASVAHDYAAESDARQLIAAVLQRRQKEQALAVRVDEAIIVLPTVDANAREVLLVREGQLRWRGALPATAVEDVLAARLAELWMLAAQAAGPDSPLAAVDSSGKAEQGGVGAGSRGEQLSLLNEAPPKRKPTDEASRLVSRWLYAHPNHPNVLPMPAEREATQDALRSAAQMIRSGW